MTAEEYTQFMKEAQEAVRMVAVQVILLGSDATLDAALKIATDADGIGWIFDPTKYREAMTDGRLDRQRKLIEFLRRTRRDLRDLFPGDAVFWDALSGVK